MNILTDSTKRAQELNLKQFEIRKTAKLCICFVFIVQFFVRLSLVFWDPSLTPKAKLALKVGSPICALIPLIIAIEYFLFKKKGPVVAKYSKVVDIIILLCFTAEWLIAVMAGLFRTQQSDPPSFRISALFGFTAFSWRTLLVTLLVQKWQLKIIAPILATLLTTGYAVYFCPHRMTFMLIRSAAQLFNIIIIVYCEDKVKWKLMRTNLEQEKWMQVNNFILDSIPENIMILDLACEARFMSEYCKSFMKKFHFSPDDAREFFKKVRDLQQQQHFESDPMSSAESVLHIERLTTYNRLLTENDQNCLKVEDMEDLIANFAMIIKDKNLQERQFLVYNGKLKVNHQQEKSIEMKISFVQHYENDYIVLIFRDTTQRDLLVTLEETNKYKDQLLASVSHELRAPLNGTINLVESALQSKQIPENLKESLLVPAFRSSKFLLHIINDILDMSQIQQKKFRLAFQSGNIEETLRNTAQLVELQAKKKGIELMLELDLQIPKKFCTDHLRLSQIVLNLLTNAIKFTREGTVKLVAKVTIEKNVKISIEDSGIGISRENIKKLFSHYAIIDFEEREQMNPTGVGLGLNIASRLVQLLAPENHKNINVVSIPNQGSIFTFILENKVEDPRKSIDPKDLEKSCEVADELVKNIQPKFFKKFQTLNSSVGSDLLLQKNCLCPKVLIVDDNPFNTMALETILSSLEVSCNSVYSGSSAIQKLLNHQTNNPCSSKECKAYCVIFMDQEMPEMSGAETVKEIKRLQGENLISQNIRIIGCTAHKAKEEVEKFLASGLDHCIYKPVSIVMIKDILKEFVS